MKTQDIIKYALFAIAAYLIWKQIQKGGLFNLLPGTGTPAPSPTPQPSAPTPAPGASAPPPAVVTPPPIGERPIDKLRDQLVTMAGGDVKKPDGTKLGFDGWNYYLQKTAYVSKALAIEDIYGPNADRNFQLTASEFLYGYEQVGHPVIALSGLGGWLGLGSMPVPPMVWLT